MARPERHRFDGHIVGAGTAEGTRLVLGAWWRTPHGPFADVMIARPDGHRILLAPDPWVAAFVAGTYVFDEVREVPVHLTRTGTYRGSRWRVIAGELAWSFEVAGRTPLGRILRAVPPPLARSRTFAGATNVVARAVLPGVRTLGSAGHGRTEWYAARDLHALSPEPATWRATWRGHDLGALRDVDPPPNFGFGSTPRTPSLTALTTIVEESGQGVS